MSNVRCPVCGDQFDTEKTKAMPFCSERCRTIDLGRWFNESYSVTVDRKFDEEEEGEIDRSRYDEG